MLTTPTTLVSKWRLPGWPTHLNGDIPLRKQHNINGKSEAYISTGFLRSKKHCLAPSSCWRGFFGGFRELLEGCKREKWMISIWNCQLVQFFLTLNRMENPFRLFSRSLSTDYVRDIALVLIRLVRSSIDNSYIGWLKRNLIPDGVKWVKWNAIKFNETKPLIYTKQRVIRYCQLVAFTGDSCSPFFHCNLEKNESDWADAWCLHSFCLNTLKKIIQPTPRHNKYKIY